MIVTTIACTNYLPYASMMAQSFRRFHSDATIIACIYEKCLPNAPEHLSAFDRCIVASALPYDDFEAFTFRYDTLEATTAIKAKLFQWLMDAYPGEDLFIFLDPDIEVFSRFSEVIESDSPILVTPHHLKDETSQEAIRDNMYRTLQCGIFNLGFLALRRGAMVDCFLQWWDGKLASQCYIDFDCGLFTDQKWMDMAMSFFDLSVLRHEGYNVANWNISHRALTRREGIVFAGNVPLRCFHYSGLSTGRDMRLLKKYAAPNDLVFDLRGSYKNRVAESDQAGLWMSGWSYGRFDSGESIHSDTRLACRRNPELLKKFPSPFTESNEAFLEIGW